MEQEKMEEIRNLPLNSVQASSLNRLNSANEMNESVKDRILANADITDAKVAYQTKLAKE